MMLWAMQVDIYESKPYPVVRHVFYGENKEAAVSLFKAHCGSDRFLHDCVESESFNGISCTWDVTWRQIAFGDPQSLAFG